MKPVYMTKLTTLTSAGLAAILLLVPFHAFLTVALSTLTGNYEYLRLWKEILLLGLAVTTVVIVAKTPGLWQRLWSQLQAGWLFWAVAAYVVLHLVLGLVALAEGQVNSYALLYALIINLRPLLIFVLAWVLASQSPWLHRYWKRLLLGPAVVVIGFGLLQTTVLPTDFLRSFGYGVSTIEPYQTIDEKLDYVRIQSTLRGSNPLGAYLVLILVATMVVFNRQRSRHNLALGLLITAGAVVLAVTYSRSAYIGIVLSLLALALVAVRGQQARRRLWTGLAVCAVVAAGVFAVFRENDRFENTFFHTNEQSQSAVSSNAQRLTFLQTSAEDVLTEPFGRGPGTAGPASVHNSQPSRIAENYYLQIGQETGWLGLGLFIAILAMIAGRLWRLRADPLARALVVSLVGLSFINLVQHAWTDDTLVLLWWGFAGIALAPTLNKKSGTATKTAGR